MAALSPKPIPARNEASYPDRITLSEPAEHYLTKLGQDLLLGRVELWQLPPSLSQIFTFAFAAGAASRQGEIDQAEASADRFYARWLNPGTQLAEVRRDQIERAAEDYWQQFLNTERPQLNKDREAA